MSRQPALPAGLDEFVEARGHSLLRTAARLCADDRDGARVDEAAAQVLLEQALALAVTEPGWSPHEHAPEGRVRAIMADEQVRRRGGTDAAREDAEEVLQRWDQDLPAGREVEAPGVDATLAAVQERVTRAATARRHRRRRALVGAGAATAVAVGIIGLVTTRSAGAPEDLPGLPGLDSGMVRVDAVTLEPGKQAPLSASGADGQLFLRANCPSADDPEVQDLDSKITVRVEAGDEQSSVSCTGSPTLRAPSDEGIYDVTLPDGTEASRPVSVGLYEQVSWPEWVELTDDLTTVPSPFPGTENLTWDELESGRGVEVAEVIAQIDPDVDEPDAAGTWSMQVPSPGRGELILHAEEPGRLVVGGDAVPPSGGTGGPTAGNWRGDTWHNWGALPWAFVGVRSGDGPSTVTVSSPDLDPEDWQAKVITRRWPQRQLLSTMDEADADALFPPEVEGQQRLFAVELQPGRAPATIPLPDDIDTGDLGFFAQCPEGWRRSEIAVEVTAMNTTAAVNCAFDDQEPELVGFSDAARPVRAEAKDGPGPVWLGVYRTDDGGSDG